jgi:circadian clock protein KaiC
MNMEEKITQPARLRTGVTGFDELLGGGLPANHIYLLMGDPGTGKTTLGFQFLQEGVRRGETVLYVTLLQSERDLRETAASHGWDLAGIEIRILISEAEKESALVEQTLLPSSEVQLNDVMIAIEKAIEEVRPTRMVFDSIEQIRLLAGEPVIYRQKVLSMQRMLDRRSVTALFVETSEQSPEFKTLAHGVFLLDTVVPPFGEMNRRLRIEKVRGVSFTGGYHSFRIRTGGLEVYPRLPISKQAQSPQWMEVKSGIEPLDRMLGGGLTEGTACLIAGESGTGKSSLATAYAVAAAARGEHAVIFLFDERRDTFLRRSQSLGTDLLPFLEQGLMTIHQVNIGDMSAGEMAHSVRKAVEEQQAKVVVLDSLTGFFQALPQEPQLMSQLHEMLAYLSQKGVLSLMIVTEHGILGQSRGVIDASFISDSVILLRRFEAMGGIRVAVSVIKKRHGNHEKLIRELQLTSGGIEVGEPLKDFQGVLTGAPTYFGAAGKLMDQADDGK